MKNFCVAGFGEVMLRLCPTGKMRFAQTLPGNLVATYGGGEANVCASVAMLGAQSRYLTALPETLSGSTMSGDLEITLPRGSQCRTSFRTKTGELSCSGEGINTSPGPLLELSTISGDVTVTA